MKRADRWLLPDGIDEMLPEKAEVIEKLRRKLLDIFANWGYQLVMPPLVEFTDSLLVGMGEDIDHLTFKSVDHLSGRQLGVRADITPQVARIDAHSLAQQGPARLCYAGSVLHNLPTSLTASRSPIQIGAELYGVASVGADIEVICLMLETLSAVDVPDITVDLGHVSIYKNIISQINLSQDQQDLLFDALLRKSSSEIDSILHNAGVDAEVAARVRLFSTLHGDASVLEKAKSVFTDSEILSALDQLSEAAAVISARFPKVCIYFDLSELRGYNYHTGIVFAAYSPSSGQAIANGGRYDHIGEVFGRARPATGFNADLKALFEAVSVPSSEKHVSAIHALDDSDPAFWQAIENLRLQGECVIIGFSEQVIDKRCDRQLVFQDQRWQVLPLV